MSSNIFTQQIKVLIADDSSVARLMLNSILSTDNEIKVVGEKEVSILNRFVHRLKVSPK